jgi:hypothetical protein
MSNPIDELSILLQRNSVSGRESVIERIKKICKAKTQIIDSLDILQSLFERNASLVTYPNRLVERAHFRECDRVRRPRHQAPFGGAEDLPHRHGYSRLRQPFLDERGGVRERGCRFHRKSVQGTKDFNYSKFNAWLIYFHVIIVLQYLRL